MMVDQYRGADEEIVVVTGRQRRLDGLGHLVAGPFVRVPFGHLHRGSEGGEIEPDRPGLGRQPADHPADPTEATLLGETRSGAGEMVGQLVGPFRRHQDLGHPIALTVEAKMGGQRLGDPTVDLTVGQPLGQDVLESPATVAGHHQGGMVSTEVLIAATELAIDEAVDLAVGVATQPGQDGQQIEQRPRQRLGHDRHELASLPAREWFEAAPQSGRGHADGQGPTPGGAEELGGPRSEDGVALGLVHHQVGGLQDDGLPGGLGQHQPLERQFPAGHDDPQRWGSIVEHRVDQGGGQRPIETVDVVEHDPAPGGDLPEGVADAGQPGGRAIGRHGEGPQGRHDATGQVDLVEAVVHRHPGHRLPTDQLPSENRLAVPGWRPQRHDGGAPGRFHQAEADGHQLLIDH